MRWAWVVLLGAAACTPMSIRTTGQPATGPSPQDELTAGATALESDDFATAALHLARLTDGCLDEPVARRAALLHAAMELDPVNPKRSPEVAAALAARVLRAAPADEVTHAQARVLYRLAVDAGGSGRIPSEVATCATAERSTRRLPPTSRPTTHHRLRTLSDSLEAQADSLAVRSQALAAQADSLEHALARVRDAEHRARALEEELDRIRTLLRGGTEPRS